MAGKELVQYGELLQKLKEKIKSAQQRAILAVNNELLSVYWEIGNAIAEQEQEAGWGGKIVDKLASDLKSEFPVMKGLSPRNLRYMRDFSLAYPNFLQQSAAKTELPDNKQNAILQVPPAKLKTTSKDDTSFLQSPLAKLTWYHHITLLDKVKDTATRYFYVQKTVDNGWSRNTLVHQIESGLHKTQGALLNNFSNTMPAYQSELTAQVFKDPYNFDFIMLGEQAKERDLEDALMTQVTKVLLELGAGFAFMGRQRRFEAGGRDFFIDLLFYHTKLRRHIIIELKIGEFEPEYVSKMNLYLGLADDQLKGEYDEPAIGLILCKTNNKIVAEYALRDTSKPIGIAEYRIAERLPDDIKGELPSIEEIENTIENEFNKPENTIDAKLAKLKERIGNLKTKDAVAKNTHYIQQIYNQFLIPFFLEIKERIEKEFLPLFNKAEYLIYVDGAGSPYYTSYDFEKTLLQRQENIRDFEISISLRGLKKAGTEAFDTGKSLKIELENYRYKINYSFISEENFIKLYSEIPTKEEHNIMIDYMLSYLIDTIEKKIEKLN
jgi:predicted nuclease of restriction endonuclease-like (RecB) superfamily